MTYTYLWTAKYLADGATCIGQIIAKLQGQIEALRDQQSAGVTLARPVDGGFAEFVTDNAQTASTFGFDADEDDGDGNIAVPVKATPRGKSVPSSRRKLRHRPKADPRPRRRPR